MNLNEIEELLLTLDVVVEPGKRDAARTADVPYRSPLVPFVRKLLRRMPEDQFQLARAQPTFRSRTASHSPCPESNVRSTQSIVRRKQSVKRHPHVREFFQINCASFARMQRLILQSCPQTSGRGLCYPSRRTSSPKSLNSAWNRQKLRSPVRLLSQETMNLYS